MMTLLIVLLCVAPVPLVARASFSSIWNKHRNCELRGNIYRHWSCGKSDMDMWDLHKRMPVAWLALFMGIAYPLTVLLWAFSRPTRTERIEAAEKSLREREKAIETRQRELEAATRKLDRL